MTFRRSSAGPRRRHIAAGTIAALSLTLAASGSALAQSSEASAPTPEGIPASTWAWVVARHPGTSQLHASRRRPGQRAGRHQHGLPHRPRQVHTWSSGASTIDHGVVQVTALASTPAHLHLGRMGRSVHRRHVACYTRSGDPANSAFSISYLTHHRRSRRAAEGGPRCGPTTETTHSYTPRHLLQLRLLRSRRLAATPSSATAPARTP